MEKVYSNRELFDIAKENYQTLLFHCVKLHTEGYWTKPEGLLKQTIREQLDLYLQALLVLFAVQSGHAGPEQRRFACAIPDRDLLGAREGWRDRPTDTVSAPGAGAIDEVVGAAKKVLAAPPILLQLFALRDREKETHLCVMFVDTLLNIVIAMSFLDGQKGAGVAAFLREYGLHVQAFLNEEIQFLTEIDERYVFRKISSSTFATGCVRDESEAVRMECASPAQPEPLPSAQPPSGSQPAQSAAGSQSVQVDADSKSDQEPAGSRLQTMDAQQIARETAKARLELEQARDAKRAVAVQKWMDELQSLVGLSAVKEEMQSLVNLIKVRKMRDNYHLPQMEMSYHMVFTGNAGTGKTTVARLVANIYRELGVLSRGTFVETDRAGLVAGYLGQTALKVKEVVERAKGGVLFIDEAYSLSNREAGDDYGREAIDTLVKEMEDNREDLVVIVAGYRQEMERFLKSNTGLISRFNKFIDFPDYTVEQLAQILEQMAQRAGMTIEEEAVAQVRQALLQMEPQARANFGNARGIRNAFERIVTNQANRIVQMDNPSAQELSRILLEDVTFKIG